MIPSIEHPTGRPNFYIVYTDQGVYAYSYRTYCTCTNESTCG